jgi:hypothetical protein
VIVRKTGGTINRPQTNARSDGQDQTFLDYQHTDVHFVFAFLWKAVAQIRPEVFSTGLTEKGKTSWVSPLLHERVIGKIGVDGTLEDLWIGAYQPTFVLQRRCLELSGYLPTGKNIPSGLAWLVVPLKVGTITDQKRQTTEES